MYARTRTGRPTSARAHTHTHTHTQRHHSPNLHALAPLRDGRGRRERRQAARAGRRCNQGCCGVGGRRRCNQGCCGVGGRRGGLDGRFGAGAARHGPDCLTPRLQHVFTTHVGTEQARADQRRSRASWPGLLEMCVTLWYRCVYRVCSGRWSRACALRARCSLLPRNI